MQSAPDGEAIVYEGTAFDSEASALLANQYLARRDPKAGWQTRNLTPLHLGQGGTRGYKAFGADLGHGVLEDGGSESDLPLSPEAPAGYQNLYAQVSSDPSAPAPLVANAPPNRPAFGSGNFEIRYAGASADLSRIFFSANDALSAETPFAPAAADGGPTKFNLYEWHEGAIALVNVAPGNATTEPGAAFGAGSAQAISADGARAFFEDEAHQTYVREDGERTKAISTEGGPDPGRFLAAAADGSAVLLANGHLHSLGGEEPTVDLTQGKGGFEGVAGQSEDLSHVYLVDTEVLDEAPNQEGEAAEAGKLNLYAWSEGAGTRFVARLAAADNDGNYGADWEAAPNQRTAEASPAGRYLAFLSVAPLSGYDNGGRPEAFLYDSATEALRCASCNPSGERPLGRTRCRGSSPLAPSSRAT